MMFCTVNPHMKSLRQAVGKSGEAVGMSDTTGALIGLTYEEAVGVVCMKEATTRRNKERRE